MAEYRRNFNYHYQGRKHSRVHLVLRGIIIFLVVILALLLTAALFLQEYMVYSDEGVTLQLPWSNASDSLDPAPSYSAPILITDEEESPSPSGLQEPLRAVLATQTALLAGTATDQVLATGGNAVVLTMKNDDGTLNYVSAVPLAVSSGASGADPLVNVAIKELNQGDLYTVAQVSCFRDHNLPSYDSSFSIRTNSGYRWVDFEEIRWVSPANQQVLDYLIDLCIELAQLGFDEILLTNCGFPTASDGTLGWIKAGEAYPKGNLDSVLINFLNQLQMALEPYEIKLSVELPTSELVGETTVTGLTKDNVLATFDRVWLDEQEVVKYQNFFALDEQLKLQEKLVAISTVPGSDDKAWAILS